MNKPTTARDIMVTRLVTLTPEMDVFEAIGLLVKNRISGAPVVDSSGALVGVFSEGCSMSVLIEGAYGQLPTTKVESFMDTSPATIDEDADLLKIAQLFRATHTRRLPVLRDGKLVGQISRRDLLKAAHKELASAHAEGAQPLYLSSIFNADNPPL